MTARLHGQLDVIEIDARELAFCVPTTPMVGRSHLATARTSLSQSDKHCFGLDHRLVVESENRAPNSHHPTPSRIVLGPQTVGAISQRNRPRIPKIERAGHDSHTTERGGSGPGTEVVEYRRRHPAVEPPRIPSVLGLRVEQAGRYGSLDGDRRMQRSENAGKIVHR